MLKYNFDVVIVVIRKMTSNLLKLMSISISKKTGMTIDSILPCLLNTILYTIYFFYPGKPLVDVFSLDLPSWLTYMITIQFENMTLKMGRDDKNNL